MNVTKPDASVTFAFQGLLKRRYLDHASSSGRVAFRNGIKQPAAVAKLCGDPRLMDGRRERTKRISHKVGVMDPAFELALAAPPAKAADPIKIGVIAETSAIKATGIRNGAKMAAEEINKGRCHQPIA
jgi:hypothetical protein